MMVRQSIQEATCCTRAHRTARTVAVSSRITKAQRDLIVGGNAARLPKLK
jgi:hypothetical protein